MPSPNIANYDYSATYDISGSGVLKIQDASAFIGSGASLVQGENYVCTAPNGAIFHTSANWGAGADIPPPIASQILTIPLPQFNGEVLWGLYTIVGTIKDQDGTLISVTKTQLVCKPSGCCDDSGNNSCAQLDVSFDCIGSTTLVQDLTKFVYQNLVGTPVYNIQVNYPLNSPSPVTYTVGSFGDSPVYNGLYTFVVNDIASYNFGNNQFVIVGYKKTISKNSFCSVSICDMYCALAAYLPKYEAAQSTTQAQTFEKNIIKLNFIVNEVMLGLKCGEDVGDLVAQIESITGKNCACGCGQQIPVSGNPATNTFTFESGGGDTVVTVTTVGSNTTVVIKDITYVLQPAMGQTGLTISSSLTGQTKTYFLSISGDELPIANSTILQGVDPTNVNNSPSTGFSVGTQLGTLLGFNNTQIANIRSIFQGGSILWLQIPFAAGWNGTSQYAIYPFGNVQLRGLTISIASGITINSTPITIATLPLGARPKYSIGVQVKALFTDSSGNSYADVAILIATNGNIEIASATSHTVTGNAQIGMDGIIFSTIS